MSAVAGTGGFCVIVCNNPRCTDKNRGESKYKNRNVLFGDGAKSLSKDAKKGTQKTWHGLETGRREREMKQPLLCLERSLLNKISLEERKQGRRSGKILHILQVDKRAAA